MAIQIAVPMQQGVEALCSENHARRKSRRKVICSNNPSRVLQRCGPSHDWENSNATIVKLLPLVKRVALQLRSHLPSHVELDDLISEGTVGLIDAVRKFDAARGVTIESYARYRIRGAILDSLREQDHASRDMRRRIRKIESTCQDLERRLGRPASDQEMADAMGMDLDEWYQRVAELQLLGFEGAGSRLSPDVGKRVNEEDLPAPPDGDPFALCYRREQRDLLSSALACLTERERSIMTLYYKDALTMKQIGERLGIDESRVSQLHSGATARLRSRVAGMLGRPSAVFGRAAARTPSPAQA